MTATETSIKVLHRTNSKSYNLLINHSIECLNFNQMLITLSGLLIGFAVVFGSAAPLFADYTLILKNGRTVTVAAYKEEGDMIIFSSYGGEIGIAKKDVQSIIPAVEGLATRQVSPQTEEVPAKPPELGPRGEKIARPGQEQGAQGMKDEPLATKEKILTPEEIKAEERAEEERQYRTKVKEVTARIKALRDRFAVATRRTPGPEPSLLDSPEAIRARTADLNSRLKDAARTPAGSSGRGDVRLEQPSPFTGASPTTIDLKPGRVAKRVQPPLAPYSPKEKKLSQLRGQMLALEKERDRLIQEMRDRNFNTASLFLE